jgi:hypothetical protein
MSSNHSIFDIISNAFEVKKIRVITGTTNKFVHKYRVKYHLDGKDYLRYFGSLEWEDAISLAAHKTESP